MLVKIYTHCQAALRSHPDKVAPELRAEAEIQFKQISQAFEILGDDDKRAAYDTHGMAAFENGSGGAGGPDMEDVLAQMFGFGMGGGPGGPGGRPKRPRRGADEEQLYEVTLEELYKGKTTHFSSTKNVICPQCTGTGGKDKAKPKQCDTCKGQGQLRAMQQVGPGLVTQVMVPCSTCNGEGQFFKDKDRCKRCKAKRVVEQKKKLELYIPPGSREGERIVLQGEADQHPDQDPGDIVFILKETPHDVFRRAGADLVADLHVSLFEALAGFSRVVLKHLDGRAISLSVQTPTDLPLEPDQTLRIRGEGMPIKRSDGKGNLYLIVHVEFPEKGWLASNTDAATSLKSILPASSVPEITPDGDVDEVDVEFDADIEEFGAGSGDPRAAEWEDDDEDAGQPQCQQQ